jgi:hypothetical protein
MGNGNALAASSWRTVVYIANSREPTDILQRAEIVVYIYQGFLENRVRLAAEPPITIIFINNFCTLQPAGSQFIVLEIEGGLGREGINMDGHRAIGLYSEYRRSRKYAWRYMALPCYLT